MKTQSAAGTEWITAGVSQSWCKVRRVERGDWRENGVLWREGRAGGRGNGGKGEGINSLEGYQWC